MSKVEIQPSFDPSTIFQPLSTSVRGVLYSRCRTLPVIHTSNHNPLACMTTWMDKQRADVSDPFGRATSP